MPHKNIEERIAYNKKYYFNNKKKIREKRKLYLLNNKEKMKKYRIEYCLKNKDKIKKTKILSRLKHKKKLKEINKLYKLNNRSLVNADAAKRRAAKLNATPKFANINKIKEIYKNCPKGYHVDHIVPLQGENVCGLHVEWNLQYLTPSANLSKSNKLII